MNIRRKLLLLLALSATAGLVLAAAGWIYFNRGAATSRAMRVTGELRREVLFKGLRMRQLLIAADARHADIVDELVTGLRESRDRMETTMEQLVAGGGPRAFPVVRSEKLKNDYRYIMELLPLYLEALQAVSYRRDLERNAAFVAGSATELANRLDNAMATQERLRRQAWNRIRLAGILLLIVLATTLAAVAWLVHRQLMTPLDTVTRRMRMLTAGAPLEAKLPARRRDEIGDLCRYFNVFVDRLREVDQLKDSFLSNMSHEIRTPLNGVIGFLENLAETDLNKQQAQYVRLIQSSARALLGVINDVLDFSKISAGRMELESVAFDLQQLVKDLVDVTREAARDKDLNVLLDAELAPDTIIRGDPTRLRQVLSNLLNNAVKFTENGEIRLGVDMDSAEDGEASFTFSVSDTGVGMSRDQQRRVFEPFTQAETATTRQHGGTGLGLCIARNLVTLMGGQLMLNSQRGKGSRFWFRMTAPLAPPEEQIQLSQHYDITFAPGSLRSYLVMVVDDNPTNLFLMETICQGIGLPYITAVNGKDAVDKAEQYQFDLIFMDIQMPVMDGYTAIRRIRKSRQSADSQIIALTASAMQEDVEAALGAGSTGFLAKPFERNQLLLCIAEHLGVPFERNLKSGVEEGESPHEAIVREMYDFMREQYQVTLGEIKLILTQSVVNWRPQVEDILVFARKENWEAVGRTMHTLKGQLSSIGLPDLADKAGGINRQIKAGETASLQPVLQQFVNDLSGVFSVIEQQTLVSES